MDPDIGRFLNMFPALCAGSRSNDEGDAEAAARYQLQDNEEVAEVSSIRGNYYAGNRPRHLCNDSWSGLNRNVDQARLFHPMQLLDDYTQVGHAHDPSWNQQYQVQPRSTHVHGTTFFPDGSSAGLDVFPPGTRISNYSNDHMMGPSYANHRALDSSAFRQSQPMMNSSHSQACSRPSPEGGACNGSALESTKRTRKRKSDYSPTPEGELKEFTVGLRQWLSLECSSITENRDKIVVRTTCVAYAIVELMGAARRSSHQFTAKDLTSALNADNFAVSIGGDSDCDDFGKIVGMRCSNPPSTLRMITPTFVPSTVFGSESKLVSEYLEVAVDPAPLANSHGADNMDDSSERDLSRQLGSLLLYIYQQIVDTNVDRESSDAALGSAKSLLEQGYTSSVQLLVTELLDGKLTLDEASIDLHAMLLAPSIFLHDNEPVLAQPQPTLRLGKKKLYGREDEQSAITDAFCRVATSGTNEALLIGGFSGSGKSSLVDSVLPYVSVAGGFVISKKFCQSTNDSSLTLVIESFNELVNLLIEECTKEELESVASDLLSSLGMSFLAVLQNVLPAIELIFADASPETLASLQTQQRATGPALTSHSVQFLLERFVCAISSSERPVLLHYDDIQWCSPQCLKLIADVLSADENGSHGFFLICSYRDNEIVQSLLDGFTESLGRFSMPIHRIQLHGISYEPFQNMVSELMSMLPRHIKSLTMALYEKTKGNPFFTFRFIESLVDKKLLTHDKGAKRWTWTDLEDQEVTENVVHILKEKMRKLDSETQEILRIAAAFDGLTESLINRLGLRCIKLKMTVDEGILRRAKSGDYFFNHDKFREASITGDEIAFRHSLGMRLLRLSPNPDSDPLLLGITDCIDADTNGGLLNSDSSDILLISNLNKIAGEKAAKNSDFCRATGYLQTALSLLPRDHWDAQYNFSIELHLLLAQCALASSNLDLAKKSLRQIISRGRELNDTLDAHFKLILMTNLVRGKQGMALSSCMEILGKLEEHVDSSGDSVAMVVSIRHKLNSRSDAELFNFKQLGASDTNSKRRLQFLSQACLISAMGVDPKTNLHVLARSVEISLSEGYSQDTPFAFAAFGLVLCGRGKQLEEGKRLLRIAMKLYRERFNDPSQLSIVFLVYYGFFAFIVLPLQTCAEKLREASIMSLGFGDVTMAISLSQQAVQKSFHAGMILSALASEIERHIRRAVKFKDDANGNYGRYLLKTVSVLRGGESSYHLSEAKPENDMLRMIDMYHQFIQSFWLGHYQRCHYLISKSVPWLQANDALSDLQKLQEIMMKFYLSIACCSLLRTINSKPKKNEYNKAIAAAKMMLSQLAPECAHNYENKRKLLQAEIHSCDKKDEAARQAYRIAIMSAKSSNFIHEEGLAFELAGKHCRRANDKRQAREYLSQAIMCYQKWGCKVKVDALTNELSDLDYLGEIK